eukprot:TRINITY_DN33389_c0_g1_i1.p1 TRINITY_DN33389_c0_g1~~TRINITY_DN33389_c0_g1_i1.p1  ORF type:complete len:478 (-),score=57.01 TRINITY_DN33389_c0_g1_i1:40-1473(-)
MAMSTRMRRSSSSISGSARKLCPYGVKCYRRNPEHLQEVAHPFDNDYLYCCAALGITPEFVSIRKLFEWIDKDGIGKATRENLGKVWPEIQRLGEDVGELDDNLWNALDDDGNGFINFSEFAEFTTDMKVGLPLGLDDLFEENSAGTLRCGVFECSCTNFTERRRKCKWGMECYQKNPDHKTAFSHPGDDDWDERAGPGGRDMCRCGHKRKLHSSGAVGAAAVPYPDYWRVHGETSDEFLELVDASDIIDPVQELVTQTYSDVTTRDRVRHSGSWMVPCGFTVVSIVRNENSKLWRKYCVRKAELQQEKRENPDAYPAFDDVLSTLVWTEHSQQLDSSINEWYLWHGTSSAAAENICKSDFKMRLAGTATGTLYGLGSYLAESITKADEYSKPVGDIYTVLLCRVLGGQVRYCDERTPDPDALTRDCVEGEFDCILGDRKKISGTYREFIVFDTENVYPEYIVKYRRGELFKSPSHP